MRTHIAHERGLPPALPLSKGVWRVRIPQAHGVPARVPGAPRENPVGGGSRAGEIADFGYACASATAEKWGL